MVALSAREPDGADMKEKTEIRIKTGINCCRNGRRNIAITATANDRLITNLWRCFASAIPVQNGPPTKPMRGRYCHEQPDLCPRKPNALIVKYNVRDESCHPCKENKIITKRPDLPHFMIHNSYTSQTEHRQCRNRCMVLQARDTTM